MIWRFLAKIAFGLSFAVGFLIRVLIFIITSPIALFGFIMFWIFEGGDHE